MKYSSIVDTSDVSRWSMKTYTTNELKNKIISTDISKVYPYYSSFDSVYPWSSIKRCVVLNWVVWYYLNEYNWFKKTDGTDSILTGVDGDAMVEVGAFFYKAFPGISYEISSIIPTKDVNGICNNIPSGFKVHPWFLNKNGTISLKKYYSAFESSLVADKVRSIVLPLQNNLMVNKTWIEMRNAIKQTNVNYSMSSYLAYSAIQMLYIVEFSTFDSKTVPPKIYGVSPYIPGETVSLGNKSGSTPNAMSYRGIENFYGNTNTFLDGLYIKDDGYYFTKIVEDFGDIAKYNKTGTPPTTVESFITEMEQIEVLDFAFIPKSFNAGSSTTYFCNKWVQHIPTMKNIAIQYCSANWGSNDYGMFSMNYSKDETFKDEYTSARIVM